MDNTATQFDWSCNTCGQQEGVENGICPKCGPTQTTPLSDAAKIEAGVPQAEAERAKQNQVIEGEVVEPSATEK